MQQKCHVSYHPEAIKFPHKESQCYFINLIEEKIGLPNLQTDKIAKNRTGQKGGCIMYCRTMDFSTGSKGNPRHENMLLMWQGSAHTGIPSPQLNSRKQKRCSIKQAALYSSTFSLSLVTSA